MHEMSLAGGVLQLVEDTLRAQPPVRLRAITVDVGALAGVDLAALRFALEALRAGTVLQDAQIEIQELPASAWCLDCAQSVEISSRLDDCPRCGGRHLQPLAGSELRLRELIVDDLVSESL
ncbi:hydrogenase nickel incorporation protein HypA/HybF [Solimonas aquatica]|uniref:Hydrogenase maturation factor HypA n=1 Tax=Solimonas aquatica TaxID=489703 RepID=A0A1H9FXP8_9GAMM|nr:hydrogenase maturation nickel metallochaperone HypA [Solimonas aquatica]SEQ42637.1 hydrogenase nickel incorporation protein HypA/HybF [Solimonas aquatica]